MDYEKYSKHIITASDGWAYIRLNELEKVRLPFNVSSIAQEAAILALENERFLNDCIVNNRKVIENVYKKLDSYNIECIKTEANFIMIDTKHDCKIIAERLLENGFIVRPGFPNMNTFIFFSWLLSHYIFISRINT